MLAWVRSGLTVMAIGFVVARFGLFLTLIAATSASAVQAHRTHWPSSVLGIALVALGAAAVVAALVNHRAYVRSLPPGDVPRLPLPWLTSFLCMALAAIGFVLAGYLAVA